MRSRLRSAGLVALCLLVLLATMFLGTYRASQQVPDFYRAALMEEPEQLEIAGDAMEQQVLQLQNDVQDVGRWEVIFTEEQINGWLATELPRRFGQMIPPVFQNPRVEVRADQLSAACRYERSRMGAVLSLSLAIELTDQPNQVAIEMLTVRAGAIPVPRKSITDQVSMAAERLGFPLQWDEAEDRTVALLQLPQMYDERHFEVLVEEIQLEDGQVRLIGRSRRTDSFLDFLDDE